VGAVGGLCSRGRRRALRCARSALPPALRADAPLSLPRRKQADKAELQAWEVAQASARSQGLFFKGLYKPPAPLLDADGNPLPPPPGGGLTPEVHALRERIKEPARGEVASPMRLYLFGYLTCILLAAVGSDLASEEPSLAIDALYVAIAAGLGVTAWKERSALGGGGSGGSGSG